MSKRKFQDQVLDVSKRMGIENPFEQHKTNEVQELGPARPAGATVGAEQLIMTPASAAAAGAQQNEANQQQLPIAAQVLLSAQQVNRAAKFLADNKQQIDNLSTALQQEQARGDTMLKRWSVLVNKKWGPYNRGTPNTLPAFMRNERGMREYAEAHDKPFFTLIQQQYETELKLTKQLQDLYQARRNAADVLQNQATVVGTAQQCENVTNKTQFCSFGENNIFQLPNAVSDALYNCNTYCLKQLVKRDIVSIIRDPPRFARFEIYDPQQRTRKKYDVEIDTFRMSFQFQDIGAYQTIPHSLEHNYYFRSLELFLKLLDKFVLRAFTLVYESEQNIWPLTGRDDYWTENWTFETFLNASKQPIIIFGNNIFVDISESNYRKIRTLGFYVTYRDSRGLKSIDSTVNADQDNFEELPPLQGDDLGDPSTFKL